MKKYSQKKNFLNGQLTEKLKTHIKEKKRKTGKNLYKSLKTLRNVKII